MAQIKRIMLRSTLMGAPYEGHTDPVEMAEMSAESFPRERDQFILEGNRAFVVTLVEWRYDLGEIHLFCMEHTAVTRRDRTSS